MLSWFCLKKKKEIRILVPSVRGPDIICSYGNAVSDVIILISLYFFCQKDTAILPLMKSMNQIKLHFQICTSVFSYCPVFLVTVWKPGWEQELQKPEEKNRQDLCLSLAITDIQSVHGHFISCSMEAPACITSEHNLTFVLASAWCPQYFFVMISHENYIIKLKWWEHVILYGSLPLH